MPRLHFRLGDTIRNATSPGPDPDTTVAYERHTRTPMAIGPPSDINSGAPARMAELLSDAWNPKGEERWAPTLTTPTANYTPPSRLESYYPPRVDQAVRSKSGVTSPQADQLRDEFQSNARQKGVIRIGLSPNQETRQSQLDATNPKTGRRMFSDLVVHEGVHSLLNGVDQGVPAKGGAASALSNLGYDRTEFPSYVAGNSPLELNPQDREDYLQQMIEYLNSVDKTGTLTRKYQEMFNPNHPSGSSQIAQK